MPDIPSIRKDSLTPEEEKLGIEFYTAGKVDGGREALRRLRDLIEKIEVPHEYEGYLPDGWKNALTEVWHVFEDLEKKYEDPNFITGSGALGGS